MSGWHFINLNKTQSKEIKELYSKNKRGFGAIKVEVSLGNSKWSTSIFPDKKSETYLLPLKAEIRKKEKINEGKEVIFTIKIK